MKKIIVPIIIIIVVIVVGFVFYNKNQTEKEVINYVNSNYQELTTIAESFLKGKEENYPEYIKEINVYRGSLTDIVEFSIEKDYGFYYSTEDKPAAYNNIETEFLELGDNKYTWDEDNIKGTTSKIRNQFYFYKLNK